MTIPLVGTYTGKLINPFDINPDDVCKEDIAHHLSQINRWTGATHMPYSVAQHSILVARHCPKELKLAGLMHDAAEAYLNDVSGLLKPSVFFHDTGFPEFTSFAVVEQRAWSRICEGLDLPLSFIGICTNETIKDLDARALATERRDLMHSEMKWDNGAVPFDAEIVPWGCCKDIERRFLELYESYSKL